MNSLSSLNFYSNTSVRYADDRPGVLVLSAASAQNQSITVYEGESFILPAGIDIIELLSAPNDLTLALTVPTSINGSALPPNIIINENPYFTITETNDVSSKTFTITGFASVEEWDAAKSIVIAPPRDASGDFTCNTTLSYGANSYSWTTTVSIVDTPEITNPGNAVYDEDSYMIITAPPQILDAENVSNETSKYTVEITGPSGFISSLSHTDTGTWDVSNTVTWDDVAKKYTIYGNKDYVNAILQHLVMLPGFNYTTSPTYLTYTLTNPYSYKVTTVTQNFTIGLLHSATQFINLDRLYTKNYPGLLFASNLPQILDPRDTIIYDITFTLSEDSGFIGTGFEIGATFSSPGSWNPGTLTYSFSGAKDQVNQMLLQIRYFPRKDNVATPTVTFTKTVSGILWETTTFSLAVADAAAPVFIGNTASVVLQEDTHASNLEYGQITITPHFTDSFAYRVFTDVDCGELTDYPIVSESIPQWTKLHLNPGVSIYCNFTAPTNLRDYLDYMTAIERLRIWLKPDFTTTFTLTQQFQYLGSYDGSSFIGGTHYESSKTVSINNSSEWSVVIPFYYQEDTIFKIEWSVLDADTRGRFTSTFAQYLPDVAFIGDSTTGGRFYKCLKPNTWENPVSVTNYGEPLIITEYPTPTQTAAELMGQYDIYYQPPGDYTGQIMIYYSQTKTVTNPVTNQDEVILQTGDSDTFYIDNNLMTTDFAAPTSFSNGFLTKLNLGGFRIEDPGSGVRTYTLNFSLQQVGLGSFYASGNPIAPYLVLTGTASEINTALSNSYFQGSSVEGSGVIEVRLERNTPDWKIVTSLNIPVTNTKPAIGDYWQNGYYQGLYNGYHLVSHKPIVNNIGNYPDNFSSTSYFWNNITTTEPLTPNSLTDGVANTEQLSTRPYAYNNVLNLAKNLSYNGVYGWYVPAIGEVIFATNNLPSPASTAWNGFVSSTVTSDSIEIRYPKLGVTSYIQFNNFTPGNFNTMTTLFFRRIADSV